MLEKKIQEIGEYFVGFYKTKENLSVVSVSIPLTWKVWGKKNESGNMIITPKLSKQTQGDNVQTINFSSGELTHSEIMEFIILIKNQNIEIEAKKILYKEKIEELAKIFDTTPLSKLRNITFKLGKSSTKTITKEKEEIVETEQ